ncbi:MAG: helix-turn-helix domain-containing protein [Ruminiclostridium sp.]
MPKGLTRRATGVTLSLLQDIEAIRGKFGWNTEETAARLGVSARTYRNWINGKSVPPFSVVEKVARMCKTKPSDVYNGLHRELMNSI